MGAARVGAGKSLHDVPFAGFTSPTAFATMIIAADSFLKKPNLAAQFCANGHVRVLARHQGNVTKVIIRMSDAWHINSNLATSQELVATQVLGPL